MGRVYRAVHHPSGVAVAVKTLRAEWRDDVDRRRLLLDEATAAARLSDPRIVRLLDVGRDAHGAPFLVMELVDGVELERWLEAWPGWEHVQRVLLDVLEGLSEAHAAGIVHRDLKPANVLVETGSGRARILDFGVAALFDPLATAGAVRIAGTPEFMAPEQLTGAGPLGPWTDLYAFGVLLAFVITDASPFSAGDLQTLAAQKLAGAPALRAPRPGLEVPPGLGALVERLLAPHPRSRPRFAAEVRSELIDAGERVVDRVPRSASPTRTRDTRGRSSGDTTLDPSFQSTVFGAPAEPTSAGSIVLPAELPAASGPEHGTTLAQLRELALVGRDAERELLESSIATVLGEGGAQVVLLVGEAGIGKSRLARWGLAEVERTGAMEGAAGGYDARGSGAAGGLRHALARLLGMPPPRTARGEVDPAIAAWQWLADASVSRISASGGRSSQSGDPDLDRARLARFVRADTSQETLATEEVVRVAHAALRALGRIRPIYLWLDDVGWSADGALALIERLLEANDTPIVVVATSRDEPASSAEIGQRLARIQAHPRTTYRRLGGLDATALAALAAEVVPLAPGVAESIAALSPDSPLLVISMLREWVAAGVLVDTPDGYTPREGSDVARAVGTRPLMALIEDRVARLIASFGPDASAAEDILVRAALIGARFDAAVLSEAVSERIELAALLDHVLDRALVGGLLRADHGRVLSFDHGLAQEALLARASGPIGRHARLDVVNALQHRYGKERADIAATVAALLHEAGAADQAWERILTAIEHAAWAGDDDAARRYLELAESWSKQAPGRRPRTELANARVHYFALRYDAALEALASARALGSGDPAFTLGCDAFLADILFYQDRLGSSERTARAVLSQVSIDDPESAAIGATTTQRLGDLAILRGELGQALAFRRQSLELTHASNRPWRGRVARLNVAEVLLALGEHAQATELVREVLGEARAALDEEGIAACVDSLAHVLLVTGEAVEARELNDPLLARLEARGDLWRLTSARLVDALASVALDPLPELEARVHAFIDAFRRVPHDDAFTLPAGALLAARLLERGLGGLAREIDALFDDRRAQYRAGFER